MQQLNLKFEAKKSSTLFKKQTLTVIYIQLKTTIWVIYTLKTYLLSSILLILSQSLQH